MATLITGAAGFIGYHLAKKLLDAGEKVYGIDSLNDYYEVSLKKARLEKLKQLGPNFKFFELDICDKVNFYEEIFQYGDSVKAIVHLAGYAGVRFSILNPFPYQKNNIEGFLNILEAARKLKNLKKLVFASSSSVYGADSTPPFSIKSQAAQQLSFYGVSKRAGEMMLYSYANLYKIPAVALRFFTVYGPWGRPDMAYFSFTKNILSGKKIEVFNKGELKRDFTYVDDIVEGIIASIKYEQKADENGVKYNIFNLGNNKPEQVSDLIKILEDAIGKKAEIKYSPIPKGDMLETAADISESTKELGFKPKTTIAEGLPKFVKWYKDYYRV